MASTRFDSDGRARSHCARFPARQSCGDRGGGLLLAAWGVHWVYERFHHVYSRRRAHRRRGRHDFEPRFGWITELPVIEGDVVKKGQLLAKVDDRDMVLQREVLVAG
jgi:hypothetical protein